MAPYFTSRQRTRTIEDLNCRGSYLAVSCHGDVGVGTRRSLVGEHLASIDVPRQAQALVVVEAVIIVDTNDTPLIRVQAGLKARTNNKSQITWLERSYIGVNK